jgi:hypothetical protein
MRIVVITAALSLLAATALPSVTWAADCHRLTGPNAPPNSTGNASAPDPAGTSCENLVMPNGRVIQQNGPAVEDSGEPGATHEGTGSGGTGTGR